MGLDCIELLIRFENAFDIRIPHKGRMSSKKEWNRKW
jgi:hypothetical protein